MSDHPTEPPPSSAKTSARPRKGAVGVIVNELGQLLVIERSQTVRAPGRFCFPGGGIEEGETEQVAVKRELAEELNVQVTPLRRIWQNRTRSGVVLFWWLVELSEAQEPKANPDEVADWFWMTPDEIAARSETLDTNREFLRCLESGDVKLS